MIQKEASTGHTENTVAANIKRLRGGLSYTELSRRLQELAGWSINAVGIRRIESCERRVTVDDLMAFAVALEVSPVTLLMPVSESGDQQVSLTGLRDELTAQEAWDWLRGNYPPPGDDRLTVVFRGAAWPKWRLMEQLEQDKKSSAAWLSARRAQVEHERQMAVDLDDDLREQGVDVGDD